MKKNLREAKEGSQPSEKDGETKSKEAGRAKIIIFYLIAFAVAAMIVYYVGRMGEDTFTIKINQ